MITIHRFSEDGFVPKTQKHHYDLYQEFKNPPDLTNLNDWQKKLALDGYKSIKEIIDSFCFQDWESGVFAFLVGLPENHWIEQSLNHLKSGQRLNRKWFEKEINEMSDVYPTYGLVPSKLTAIECLQQHGIGTPVYIPARCLLE